MDGPVVLANRLRARILAEGPISWPEWMEAALYDSEGGYYTRPGRKTGPGDDADFATSPTLHPFFAHCVANEIAATWEALGCPAQFAVYEFGGGEGDLARDALAHLDAAHPKLATVVRWNHIERSPTHQEAQRVGADDRVQWVPEIPSGSVGFVVAHEFVDALPFWWLEATNDGWSGLRVGVQDGGFALQKGPCPEEITALAPQGVPEGHRVAVMHQARDWLGLLASHLRSGAVLVVDYGGAQVWRRDRDGTVRTFRRHQHAGPAWEEPGEKDITASVDFGVLGQWAKEVGFEVAWEESQEGFLLRHGVLEALNAISRDTPEGASAYLRLRQLLLPTAMGEAFRVALYRQAQLETPS